MRVVFIVFVFLGLQSALCTDCSDKQICQRDAPEVCVLHSELYCFTKYENICVWNETKCKYHLNFQEYALPFCGLENFLCRQSVNEDEE